MVSGMVFAESLNLFIMSVYDYSIDALDALWDIVDSYFTDQTE